MSLKRWTLAGTFLALFLFVALSGSPVYGDPGKKDEVDDRYIVVFKDEVIDSDDVSNKIAKKLSLVRGHVYKDALKGFSVKVPPGLLKELQDHPQVAFVEPDRLVHAVDQPLPTGVDRIDADQNNAANINGIDERVDVDIAIIDTGLNQSHPDLNVVGGRHFWTWFIWSYEDDNFEDDNGHGSHVGGTAAALDNNFGVVGVAPGARLWGVKVLDSTGSGYLSDVVAGIDWVTQNSSTIEVANMSLAWQGNSPAARTAIQNSVSNGVVYMVAAGNDSQDVYGPDGVFGTGDEFEPASYPEVATISAMADFDGQPGGNGTDNYVFSTCTENQDDSFACFSNYSNSVVGGNPVSSPGGAIDLMLPGVGIDSTYMNGGYATISGTSMASPHAAGLAGLYIAANGRASDAAGVYAIRQALIDMGMDQASGNRLTVLDEPDFNEEPLGWAGPAGPPNSPPVAYDVSASGDEDTVIAWTPSVSDADAGDILTCSITSLPANGSATVAADCSTGSYTPNANFNGSDGFVYQVSDGLAADTGTVSLTVNPVNDAPVASDDSAQTIVDTSINIAVLNNDSDVDGDTLSVASADSPTNGGGTAVIEIDNTVTYTPASGYTGTDTFGYTISDGNGGSDSATVTVTVVSNPPIADDKAVTTDEDVSVDITLSASDAETCELTFSVLSGPANGDLTAITDQACTAGIPNMDTALVTYTPDANFNGSDTFTYQVSDGSATDTGSVSLTVNPVNDSPVANDVSASGDEDTMVAWTPSVSDADAGDILTCSITSLPANGSATVAADCSTGSYTPGSDYNGVDGFTYEANDGTSDSNVANVTITVNPVNDAPVAADDAYSVDEDVTLNVTAPGVLLNDSDVEGDPLTVGLVSGPSNGSLTLNSDGSFSYAPNANYNGADSFTYQASDGVSDSNVANVTITVNPVNDAPVAANVSDTTTQDTSDTWFPNVSDVDSPPEYLSCTADLTSLEGGTVAVNSDCSSGTYDPPTNFNGTDTFDYTVCDQDLMCDSGTVTYTVDMPSADMHVGDLDGATANGSGPTWDAIITIGAHDGSHNGVEDVTVTISWNGIKGYAGGSAQCTTNASGQCSVNTGDEIPKNNESVTFTVANMTHATLTYDPTANHDADGDSDIGPDGTISIIVNKP